MKRMRIRLAAVPHDDNAANVWADVADGEGGALTVTLLHLYPDLRPAAGWWLEEGGVDYEVTAVDAVPQYQLTCSPKGGA